MTVDAVDFSMARPPVPILKAAKKAAVGRYVSLGRNKKNLTRAEAAGYQAAGIDIFTVFEQTADRSLSGPVIGASDAGNGSAMNDQCGAPPDAVLYMAVDFDVQPAQVDRCLHYLAGAADELGVERTGVYGGKRIVTAAADNGVVSYFWQTLAWSGHRDPRTRAWVIDWDPRAHIRQHKIDTTMSGFAVDLNTAMADDYGQWGAQDMASAITVADIEHAVEQVLLERRKAGVDTPAEALDRIRQAAFDAAEAADGIGAANLRAVTIKQRTTALAKALKAIGAKLGVEGLDKLLDWDASTDL